MRWAYCDRWNGLLEEPIEPFAASEAQRRHETGKLYTAIGTESDRVKVLVEVRLETGYVGVKFLDDLARNELIYSFSVVDGRLFLSEIISYDYGDSQERGDDADPVAVENFAYTPEGTCRHKVDNSLVETISAEDYHSVDVASHWEPVPPFGDYDSVTKWDRETGERFNPRENPSDAATSQDSP